MGYIFQLAIVLAAVLSASAIASNGPFSASLRMKRVYKMGDEVTCEVVITNNHNMDYYLLKRHTPLDGIKSHIFAIKGNKADIEYDGYYYKWAAPTAEEYVLVPGKSSVVSSVALSQAYGFYDPRLYSVHLDTQLLYSGSPRRAPYSQHLLSNTKFFFLAPSTEQPQLTKAELERREVAALKRASLNTVQAQQQEWMPPVFVNGWTPEERAQTEFAYSLAYSSALSGITDVDTEPVFYQQWFGKPSNSNKDTVKNVYSTIVNEMKSDSFVLSRYGDGCTETDRNMFGYAVFGKGKITLCYKYLHDSEQSGFDSKMGVIIHEMTHSVSNIKDIAGYYGITKCQLLARDDPAKAIDNADNYEYFSEATTFFP